MDITLDKPNKDANTDQNSSTISTTSSTTTSTTNSTTEDKKPLPFWRIILSVMQASFGVQTQSNYERDFKQANLLPFIVAAVLFTALFVLTVAFVVSLVLPK
jgi:hypothetical protein